LGQFEKDITVWTTSSSLPNKELKNMVSARIAEIMENQDDEDEPPWDSVTIYNNFLNHILKERHKEASKWMNGVEVTSDVIEKMSAEKCQASLNRLELKPAYLGDEQFRIIKQMRSALEDRLDDLQIEGLLVRFRQLPLFLQEEFLKLATAEVN
ncbi:MAG: hypothetical protein GY816_23540, partial [Cytophagales bacterium]|nr:hypothetical protein [Cytophagales bacterium]